LMAFGNHALDHIGPLRCAVNGTLAEVDTGHEEGSLEAGRSELVEDAVGVNVWTGSRLVECSRCNSAMEELTHRRR
jgi:hypothetical protein